MLHALVRQAKADLRSRPLQSLQIVLIVAAVTTTLTMGVGMARGANVLWDRIFAASNGPHVIFVASSAEVDFDAVGRQPEVVASTLPLPIVRTMKLAQDPRKVELWLHGWGTELPTVGRPHLVEGRWLQAGATDEVVLDANFAREIPLDVGQRLEILTPTRRVSLTLVGLAVNPMFPYPSAVPAAYVTTDSLTQIEEPRRWESLLGVRLANPEQSTAFAERVSVLYGPLLSYARDWQRNRTAVQFNNNISILIIRVASLLALIAGGLIVANTTSALVLTRFREIGLLKAIGYTPRQVTALLLIEHLALGFVGIVVGIAAGLSLLPSLFTSAFLRRTAELLSIELVLSAEPFALFAIAAWIETVVALFTLLPAWRAGRIATVPAMLAGARMAGGRHSRLGSLVARLGQPPAIVLGVRNAFARPARSWLTVTSLALTIGLATVVVVGEGTLQAYARTPALLGLPPHDLVVRRGLLSHEETRRIFDLHPGIIGSIAVAPLPALTNAQPAAPIVTRGVVAPADLSQLVILDGRAFQAPGEAIVTQGVLDRLALRVGDDLALRVLGRPLTLRIVGRYYGTDNLGLVVMYDLETVRQQIDAAIQPVEYFVTLAPGADRHAVQTSLLRYSGDRFGILLWESGEEIERLRNTIRTLGVALLLISLINLLSTTLLGVQEQIRPNGILRALGMTPTQIALGVGTTTAIQTIAAAAIGMPVGWLLTLGMFAWITGQGGGGNDVPVPIVWPAVLGLVLLGALLVALLSATLPARRAANLPIVEALRHE